MFQSWSVSSTGQSIMPSTLPEDIPHTLTNLMNDIYGRFIGQLSDTGELARSRR